MYRKSFAQLIHSSISTFVGQVEYICFLAFCFSTWVAKIFRKIDTFSTEKPPENANIADCLTKTSGNS